MLRNDAQVQGGKNKQIIVILSIMSSNEKIIIHVKTVQFLIDL